MPFSSHKLKKWWSSYTLPPQQRIILQFNSTAMRIDSSTKEWSRLWSASMGTQLVPWIKIGSPLTMKQNLPGWSGGRLMSVMSSWIVRRPTRLLSVDKIVPSESTNSTFASYKAGSPYPLGHHKSAFLISIIYRNAGETTTELPLYISFPWRLNVYTAFTLSNFSKGSFTCTSVYKRTFLVAVSTLATI